MRGKKISISELFQKNGQRILVETNANSKQRQSKQFLHSDILNLIQSNLNQQPTNQNYTNPQPKQSDITTTQFADDFNNNETSTNQDSEQKPRRKYQFHLSRTEVKKNNNQQELNLPISIQDSINTLPSQKQEPINRFKIGRKKSINKLENEQAQPANVNQIPHIFSQLQFEKDNEIKKTCNPNESNNSPDSKISAKYFLQPQRMSISKINLNQNQFQQQPDSVIDPNNHSTESLKELDNIDKSNSRFKRFYQAKDSLIKKNPIKRESIVKQDSNFKRPSIANCIKPDQIQSFLKVESLGRRESLLRRASIEKNSIPSIREKPENIIQNSSCIIKASHINSSSYDLQLQNQSYVSLQGKRNSHLLKLPDIQQSKGSLSSLENSEQVTQRNKIKISQNTKLKSMPDMPNEWFADSNRRISKQLIVRSCLKKLKNDPVKRVIFKTYVDFVLQNGQKFTEEMKDFPDSRVLNRKGQINQKINNNNVNYIWQMIEEQKSE